MERSFCMTNKKIDYLDRKGIIDITKLEPAKEGPTTKFRDSDGEKYFRLCLTREEATRYQRVLGGLEGIFPTVLGISLCTDGRYALVTQAIPGRVIHLDDDPNIFFDIGTKLGLLHNIPVNGRQTEEFLGKMSLQMQDVIAQLAYSNWINSNTKRALLERWSEVKNGQAKCSLIYFDIKPEDIVLLDEQSAKGAHPYTFFVDEGSLEFGLQGRDIIKMTRAWDRWKGLDQDRYVAVMCGYKDAGGDQQVIQEQVLLLEFVLFVTQAKAGLTKSRGNSNVQHLKEETRQMLEPLLG